MKISTLIGLVAALATVTVMDSAMAKSCKTSTSTTTTTSASTAGEASYSSASESTAASTATSSVASESDAAESASSASAASASSESESGSGLVSLAVVEPIVNCSSLTSLDITSIGGDDSYIETATEEESSGISYCSVEGILNTNVTFQTMLPMTTWTQRYMQIGCGGLCGSVSLSVGAASGSEEVTDGNFVLASTDMAGGNDGTFGLIHDRRVNFAYRAVHWTAVVSKQLISTFYGQDAAYSYFNGCSDGGREAMMEAIRYPDDFDGIIAGAPAMLFQFQNTFHHGWLALSNTDDNGDHIVIADRLDIIHDAVISACDDLDGLTDGLLSDPRLCSFDVTSIQCSSDSDNSTCLTSAEVTAITKFYTGPTNSSTDEHLTVGEEQHGSELAWSGVFVGDSTTATIMSTSTALAVLKYLAFEDTPPSDYTLADLDFSDATIDLLKARHPLFDAVSPNLTEFNAAGHKLILWHGWADPHISPRTTIAYHEALQSYMGEDVVADFERLYLLPGVYHCGSGYGMTEIDLVTPMLKWVEEGEAPNAIITSDASSSSSSGTSDFGQWASSGSSTGSKPIMSSSGSFAAGSFSGAARRLSSTSDSASDSASGSGASTVRSRPVYPYPYVAKYSGSGNVNDSSSWEQGDALYTNKTYTWAGESFFDAYTPIEG